LEATSDLFDLEAGDSRWIGLSIDLPTKLDKDLYLLRVRITDKNSQEVTATYNLKVNPAKKGLDIKDVVFSPGTTVVAGRSLFTKVLIDNFGGRDEENVKVSVQIPELGVGESDWIDEIDSDDRKTSEEFFLKLPQCVEEGDYTAVVTLEYDDYDEITTKEYTLHVLANDRCASSAGKLTITLGPDTQNVVAGQQAAYPVALTNTGNEAKTYTLELTSGEWATAQMSENLVVLEPGSTKVVYAYLTPSEGATPGEKVATLNVKADGNVLKSVYLKANLVEGKSFNLRNGLEIALIVLVVLLVIIGLIIGFSRLRKDDDLDEDDDKTYY